MKGQAVGDQFLGLVLSGVLLLIGVVVFANVIVGLAPIMSNTTSSTPISATANATINTMISTSYSAFDLATVALIVIAAAIIIGAAFLLIGFGRGRR